jgi:hypothetical protein
MKKKIFVLLGSIIVIIAGIVAVSAYESWVVNVTAHIENSLYVHPESQDFGTMFPQEKDIRSFFITTSNSFSAKDQRRVLNIDYAIKQKPKPKNPADSDWCRDNLPSGYYNDPPEITLLSDEYLAKCYPVLCYYLSKLPDNFPSPGNDSGLAAYHPLTAMATGTINKDRDPADQWVIDLDVPCFYGECAQDWTHPNYEPPAEFNGMTFGCDLWVEVSNIY